MVFNCSNCNIGNISKNEFTCTCPRYSHTVGGIHCNNWEPMKTIKMDKPYLILMVGLPGSGKSTVATNLAKMYNAVVYSSDIYRVKICNNVNDQAHNEEVFSALYKDMKEALSSGASAILDATNVSVKDRKRCLDRFSGIDCYKIAYVVNTSVNTCFENDSKRDRKVGLPVIHKMLYRFEYPQIFEGFNEIILHNSVGNTGMSFDEKYKDRMDTFNQNNYHHLYTLGEHTRKVMEKFDISDDRYEAAKYHDIGKLYTQTTDNNGVSHYYSHDNVSAYLVACNPEWVHSKYNFNLVMFYINQHMKIRNVVGNDDTERKYKNLYGEEPYNKLIEFMEADNNATGTK